MFTNINRRPTDALFLSISMKEAGHSKSEVEVLCWQAEMLFHDSHEKMGH